MKNKMKYWMKMEKMKKRENKIKKIIKLNEKWHKLKIEKWVIEIY